MTRRWTLAGVQAVWALAAGGARNGEIAEAVGRFAHEVDLALWALVGRTPEQALARLNAGARPEPVAVAGPGGRPPPTLKAFLDRMFGGARD